MKTANPQFKFLLLTGLAALVPCQSPALRADSVGAATEPRDHTLFVGLDLLIPVGGKYYEILRIENNAAVIRVGGALQRVPFERIHGYQLRRVLKVGGILANLDHIQSGRAYTPLNDPTRAWHHRESELTGYEDDQVSNAAQNAMFNAYYNHNGAGEAAELSGAFNAAQLGAPGALYVEQPGGGVYWGKTVGNTSASLSDPGMYANQIQGELAKNLFDAIEVSFEVSSPRELEDPYAVILAEFRESEKATETARWIYIKPLAPIESYPTRVHILQGGFPRGFALGKVQAYLYDRGREIPTSASANRASLTRTQVVKYAMAQYLAQHKGQTGPPTPMHDSAPAGLKDELDPSQLHQMDEVDVGPDGSVLRVSSPTDSGGVSRSVEAAWKGLCFYPALKDGKPAAATVEARLSDFLD
jgi:hypothetical protein